MQQPYNCRATRNYCPFSLTIVVLNYNGLHLLKKYLPTLLVCSNGYPVILVDNGSTDGSVDHIHAHFPTVTCTVHEKNYGVAQGYNLALQHIKSDYYLLLNNDLLVTPNWFKDPLALMEGNPTIAFCQPKILSLQQPNQFDYAGGAGGFIDAYGYPFCRGRIFNTLEKDKGQYNDTRPVFWASGACLFVRSKAFNALGGFDPLFFAHFEEIDICWRAHHRGWQVYYCGTSTVYHLGSATLGNENTKKTYLNFRNRLLMVYKYEPNDWKNIFKNICLDLLAMFRMLALAKFAHSWAIVKAQIDFLKLKRKYFTSIPLTHLPNRYKGSIVIDFFVKNKKRFFQIASQKFT